MNPAHKSKINWTALAIAIVGVIAAADVIDKEMEEAITEVALILGPVLISTFRTYFTGDKS